MATQMAEGSKNVDQVVKQFGTMSMLINGNFHELRQVNQKLDDMDRWSIEQQRDMNSWFALQDDVRARLDKIEADILEIKDNQVNLMESLGVKRPRSPSEELPNKLARLK